MITKNFVKGLWDRTSQLCWFGIMRPGESYEL